MEDYSLMEFVSSEEFDDFWLCAGAMDAEDFMRAYASFVEED